MYMYRAEFQTTYLLDYLETFADMNNLDKNDMHLVAIYRYDYIIWCT